MDDLDAPNRQGERTSDTAWAESLPAPSGSASAEAQKRRLPQEMTGTALDTPTSQSDVESVGLLWDKDFRAACEQVFGRLDNQTYAVVNRRVLHAFKVWGQRHAMNPEQYVYAWKVLAWAVLKAHRQVEKRSGIHHPYVYTRRAVAGELERVVNDPQAHEGFKRRAGLVDVRGILSEL